MRQRVELLKCLRRDPSVLILDEPTSVLTPEESEQLFDSLRKVVGEENRAVALVSHRLSEILHATDRITIMRNGAVIDRCLTKDTDANSLARDARAAVVDSTCEGYFQWPEWSNTSPWVSHVMRSLAWKPMTFRGDSELQRYARLRHGEQAEGFLR